MPRHKTVNLNIKYIHLVFHTKKLGDLAYDLHKLQLRNQVDEYKIHRIKKIMVLIFYYAALDVHGSIQRLLHSIFLWGGKHQHHYAKGNMILGTVLVKTKK